MASNGLSQRLMMLAHVSHHRRSERSRTSGCRPTMTSNGAKVVIELRHHGTTREKFTPVCGHVADCISASVTASKGEVVIDFFFTLYLRAFWACYINLQVSHFILQSLVIKRDDFLHSAFHYCNSFFKDYLATSPHSPDINFIGMVIINCKTSDLYSHFK